MPAALPRLLILRHVPFFVAGITFYGLVRKGPNPARLALLLAALCAAGLIDETDNEMEERLDGAPS